MNKQPLRKTLEEIERAKRLEQTLQVLSQPHRRGDDSLMTDPLGVFIRAHVSEMFKTETVKALRKCYDAGWEYKVMVYRWRQAKGIPNDERLKEFDGSGVELDADAQAAWEDKVDSWGRRIARCDTALKCAGLPGFIAARDLILGGVPPPVKVFGLVKRALHSLAIELGKFPS